MDYIYKEKEQELTIEEEAKRMSDEIVDLLIMYRKKLNMTQQDVADATGIQRTNIARLESKRYTASVESLKKYAKCLGYRLEFVTVREEDGVRKLPLPVGHSDYKRVSSDFCYVDKTLLIKEILDNQPQVSLFTRPRRFGKTLNMDMLRVFFEKTEEDTARYFMDKKIWRYGEDYQKHQGKYPVIFLSFKDVKGKTWDETLDYLKFVFATEFNRHPELFESEKCNAFEKRCFFKIASGESNEVELMQALQILSTMLHKHHGAQSIIIIDEYDAPIQQGYVKGYYENAVSFMRILFSGAFKDNPHMIYGFLTGILRVAKESIFSGLNNVRVNTILEKRYSEYFGFTPDEVRQMAEYYGVMEKYEEICEWYDGYRFGNMDIFNPWSVIGYFDADCEAEVYWVSTSSNDIIGEILENADEELQDSLKGLVQGNTVTTLVDMGIVYPELRNNTDSIYSFLLVTGYLKIVSRKKCYDGSYICEVAIPNKEILFVYKQEILSKMRGLVSQSSVIEIYKALYNHDVETLQKQLQQLLMKMVSYYDTSYENFYHGFVLGLCALLDNKYYVTSNREAGMGRFDIQLMPRDTGLPGILIEVKATKNCTKEALEKLAQEAMEQNYNLHYDEDMKAKGVKEIYSYGVAFCGKDVAVVTSQIFTSL